LAGDRAWGTGPHLAIARTSNDPGAGWGDYYTAAELGVAAAALGWRVTYLAEHDGADTPIPDDLDLAVVLTDRWDVRRFPVGTLLCAWVRNWTERWLTRPWLDRYDILLASSIKSARLLLAETGRPVEMFPLATNPRRFAPTPASSSPMFDWVFTGNRWGEPRAIEPALVQRRHERGAIYGRGWSSVKRLRGLLQGPLDYDRLPWAYGSAKVVLDDTAEPTLDYDAVNARVFDAVACGVPVLTNCARGAHELFDDEFPTWASAGELRQQLDGLLASPARRTELGDRYRQIVLARHTYEHRARRLRRVVAEHNERLSFCLKVGAPDWEQAERWGDLHFARGLGRALRRAGHRWRIDVLPDWDATDSSGFDVTIHLLGRSQYAPAPGQFNVLWLISHPDSFNDAVAEGYDLICVASATFAAALRVRLKVPVQVLEQATDPLVFFPDPTPGRAHELVFVGNSRGVRRKILDDLLPTEHDLAVWGAGWQETDAGRHLQAEHVPVDELRTIYSSASVVLCDHWPDMRAHGFRSNRLYDALACGALVVSDDVAGLNGSLGEAVLTYEQPGELRGLIDRLLADPRERARRVAGARERVLDHDTFDHRVRDLLASVHGQRR
jgi:glycosyltransferase involved in cell wall biosynthesis